MKQLLKHISLHKFELLYGAFCACSILLIQDINKNLLPFYSIITIAIGILLLLLELLSAYMTGKTRLHQFGLPLLEKYSQRTQLIHHIVIPVATYLAILGFVLGNNRTSLNLIYFVMNFILFSALFINIQAYYLNKYRTQLATEAVYDISKIIIYFCAVNTVVNLKSLYSLNYFVVVAIVALLAGVLTYMLLLRKKHLPSLLVLILMTGALGIGYITATLSVTLQVSNLVVSFFSALIYYTFNAIIHHELNKTLNKQVLLEYILVAAICFAVVILLTGI